MDVSFTTASILVYGFYLAATSALCLVTTLRGLHRRQTAVAMQQGQGLVEYALVLALIAVVVVGVLLVLGPSIKEIF